jgi:hypothetical protein
LAGFTDSTPPVRIHLQHRIIHYSGSIDQNSSGGGDKNIAYAFPTATDPQGTIDASSVNVAQTIDPKQADGPVSWKTQVNSNNVVVTVHTGAAAWGKHSGHAQLTVTFRYTTD